MAREFFRCLAESSWAGGSALALTTRMFAESLAATSEQVADASVRDEDVSHAGENDMSDFLGPDLGGALADIVIPASHQAQ